MSKIRMHWALICTLIPVLLAMVATVAFTQTTSGAFTITSITPNPFNPSAGQRTAISYRVPARSNYALYIRNSSGQTAFAVSYRNEPSGTRTFQWNGRDRYNRALPAGTYAVQITGKTTSGATLGAANGTVTIASSTTPPPTTTLVFTASASPSTIDPSKGEKVTFSYNVPATANYSHYVRNSAGSIVCDRISYTNVAAGTKTIPWSGINYATGAPLPDGVYTFVLEGKTTAGATITTGTANVTIKKATTTTPPPTTTLAFTASASPSTIDPSKGEKVTFSYNVPATANYSHYVRNSAGTVVCDRISYTDTAAGTKTIPWSGINYSTGAPLPDGVYTFVLEGKTVEGATITTGTANVTVKVATVVTPPPTDGGVTPTGDLGQPVDGAASGNFELLRYAGVKFGIAFQAPKSGTINQVMTQWKTDPNYGAGNLGRFTFELQTNGADNYPSGTVLARVTNVDPKVALGGVSGGALRISMSASLTAGQKYHLVIYNTDPNPSANWSSPNSLITRVVPWDATGNRGEQYNSPWGVSGKWVPYSAGTDNPFGSGSLRENGSHFPVVLGWTDGAYTGDPYYGALTDHWDNGSIGTMMLYGSRKFGQLINWNKPSVTVTKIGLPILKRGSPSGNMMYHFEDINGNVLATGVMATPSQAPSSVTQWVYATLSKPVTLQTGQRYRLWFDAPSGTSSSNYYHQPVPFMDTGNTGWNESSWGGTASTYIWNTSGSWQSWIGADLAFSMQ